MHKNHFIDSTFAGFRQALKQLKSRSATITLTLLAYLFFFSCETAQAQISISANFNNNQIPSDWTYTGFARTTSVACQGAGSVRKNQYSNNTATSTGSIVTQAWTSTGADVNLSFTYKLLNYASGNPSVATPNTPNWGTINIELSINGGSTYPVNVGTINNSNHTVSTSCAAKSYTVAAALVPSGNSIRVRFRLAMANNQNPDYFVYLDNVAITQALNDPPVCVSTPDPVNNSTNLSSSELYWPAVSGASGYRLYLGTDTDATNFLNGSELTTNTYNATLEPQTQYYWKVIPYNTNGNPSGCATWTFTTPTLSCVSGMSPLDGTQTHLAQPVLTWEAVNGVTGYDIYFGTLSNPPLVQSTDAATLSFKPVSSLQPSTPYYWKVVPKSDFGSPTNCEVSSFTTKNTLYCMPGGTGCSDGAVIGRVLLSTLDNNSGTVCHSGQAGFSDYTTNELLTTTLQPGSSYQCTVWAGKQFIGIAAWIDYNDNGIFDSSEKIGNSNMLVGSNTDDVLGNSGSFTVALPCTTPAGKHLLRFRGLFLTSGSIVTPCDSELTGETEDYYITVACPQPIALLAASVSLQETTLSWTAGCSETAWEVAVQNPGLGLPTASGIATNSIFFSYSSSPSEREFYVRAACGTGNFSSWSGPITFGTADCSVASVWNGTVWSPFEPTASQPAIISANYTSAGAGLGNLSACSLTVNNNASVIINSGDNFIISGTLNVEPGASLTLENNANLLQDPITTLNSNIGVITAKRQATIRRLDYVYWGAPVSGQDLKQFSPITVSPPIGSSRFYTLDEPANSLSVIAEPTGVPFLAGQGYVVRAPNNFPPSGALASFEGKFKGIPNNGNYIVPVTHSVTGNGSNLLGNPYPSTIDATKFLTQNPGTLYFWTHQNQDSQLNNYATFNSLGATNPANGPLAPNGFIQTGQGFVWQTPTNGVATFTNEMRVANNQGQFYRGTNSEKHRFWLSLSNANATINQILVGYAQGATNGFDVSVDGLLNVGGSSIGTIILDKAYVIQGRALPFETTDIIPLAFKAETSGSYIIKLDQFDGLFETQDIILKDNLAGAEQNLKNGAYNFATTEGSFNQRFSILYQSILQIDNPKLDADSIIIYKDNGVLTIHSGSISMAAVKVFDITGRLIYEKTGINTNKTSLDHLQNVSQILLIQVVTNDNTIISKKLLN